MYDVAIIGAGIIGGMIARELSKYDLSICILEKESDVAMGASRANSGIIHGGFDAKEGSLKAEFNVKGSKMMERITSELGVKYNNNGALVIGFNDEDLASIKELYERGKLNHVEKLEILDKESLKKLEPNISENAIGALHALSSAIVCPYDLTIAAIGNAMDNGADLKLEFEVKDIKWVGNSYELFSNKETIKTRYIINAAGVFADKIAGMVGDKSFKILPRKGEYLILDKDCGTLVSNTIFKVPSIAGKGILISPTVDKNLLLGPTSEDIADKEDVSITHSGINKILKGTSESVSNLNYKSVISSFSGIRATSNKGDFIIEQSKQNFINVAGIDSPGLSASPAIAVYVVEILKNMGTSLVKKTFYNPHRKKFSAEKSKYKKIVCRCECVSEGEILEAIHTNPKATNVDAVKRRTRSGMGRCQGGFCLPYVIEILARELKIKFEDVTKFGGNSKFNICRTKVIK